MYTSGGPGTVFTGPDIKIITNSGQGNPAFTGAVFPGRQWNGRINYAPAAFVNGLQTTFANNNSFAGNTFDVVAARNVSINGIDVNLSNPGSVNTISVYWRNGTCVTHEGNSSGWTLLTANANVISNGPGIPSHVTLDDLHLAAGATYGLYVDVTSYPSASMLYTNGGPGTQFTDGTVRITTNSGQPNPVFSAPIAGRQWNGRLYYSDTYCYVNCDGSTTAPILNVNDFTCFLNKYSAGDPYANCDGSTAAPILNVNDFTCFLNRYALGCP
jgi:hypothetical protein